MTFLTSKDAETGEDGSMENGVPVVPATRILKKNKLKINIHRPVGTRVVFEDNLAISQRVHMIIRYGDVYIKDNLAISGTHTHAGPAGYLQYVVYSVTSLGFVQQSFDAIVDAIEQSIVQAHSNLKPGSIFINTGGVTYTPSRASVMMGQLDHVYGSSCSEDYFTDSV